MVQWHQYESSQAVAGYAAERVLAIAEQSIKDRGVFKFVLAGGSTPAACYRLLSNASADWQHWQIFLGDERCLPVDHPDRNSVMANECLLRHVPVKRENIFSIPAQDGAQKGAQQYQQIVDAAMPFDLVMLGMGEDGHTASLFPGHDHIDELSVIPVHNAPKPPPDRISLNYAALQNARHMFVLITGSGKYPVMQEWLSGNSFPVSQVVESANAEIILDLAAYPDELTGVKIR